MADPAAPEAIRLFRAFRDALAKSESTTVLRSIHDQLLVSIEQLRDPPDDLIQAYNVILSGQTDIAELDQLIAHIDPPVAFVRWGQGPVQDDLRRALATLGIRVYDAPRTPNSDSTDWILSTRELTPDQVEMNFAMGVETRESRLV